MRLLTLGKFKKDKTMATDLYQSHDYYHMDDLLSDEHKLIRETAREWVKKEMSPNIE